MVFCVGLGVITLVAATATADSPSESSLSLSLARVISPNSADYDFSHIVDYDLETNGDIFILHGTERLILCLTQHGLLSGKIHLPAEVIGELKNLNILPDHRFLVGTSAGLFFLSFDGRFEKRMELSDGWFVPAGKIIVDGIPGGWRLVVPRSNLVAFYASDGRLTAELCREENIDLKGVALDADGNIYTLDQRSYTVRVYDPEGRLLRKFGRAGGSNGTFSRVLGISVPSGDEVWVEDLTKSLYHVFSGTGTFQRVVHVPAPFGGVQERNRMIFTGSRRLPGILVFERVLS